MTGTVIDEGTVRALGLDPGPLAAAVRLIDEKYVTPGRLPHAQLLVSRNGQVACRATMGKARADGTPLDQDALFRIASMTKPVTSVAFMMLVEEGRTSLEAPVTSVIPEFADLRVRRNDASPEPGEKARPMRMIDLLRHTSGLTYGLQNRTPIDAAYRELGLDAFHQDRDSDGFVTALASLPLEFQPRTAWNYSVSTDVLGVVIERLSGQRLDQLFAERIFGPLGMGDSGFTVPHERLDRLTDAWMLHPERGPILYDRGEKSRWRFTPDFFSGGGGLVSSIDDFHRFCLMLLNGGVLDGVRLLSTGTVADMMRNQLPGESEIAPLSRSLFSEAAGEGVGFGLGLAVTLDPARALFGGTRGDCFWGGVLSTFFFIDPVERMVAILMTQLMPSDVYPLRRQLKPLIQSAIEKHHG